MKLGILETGRLPEALSDVHGSFPDMFERWLAPHLMDVAFTTFPVLDDRWPSGPDACDGWLITGSRFGVYDDEPWIPPLMAFIRDAAAARVPILGICFGHQIVAEAMGGKAVKSPRGWGAGIHRYCFAMDGTERILPMLVSHQDQVVAVPPGATVLGGSDHCPFGVLEYDAPILTVQFHPEFDPALSASILRERAGITIPEAVATKALDSLGTPPENRAAGAWMGAWLARQMKA
ncbi:glutamine amidotransferase-related protein [Minwuia sp.]|uniref:glutamine amidotransferase-related protein n=1 Tax=Minwuia sp. TaxID=2493630 RepID=UPI003A91BA83